jgi:hypothetical protein
VHCSSSSAINTVNCAKLELVLLLLAQLSVRVVLQQQRGTLVHSSSSANTAAVQGRTKPPLH